MVTARCNVVLNGNGLSHGFKSVQPAVFITHRDVHFCLVLIYYFTSHNSIFVKLFGNHLESSQNVTYMKQEYFVRNTIHSFAKIPV